jgi:hypothetical protein
MRFSKRLASARPSHGVQGEPRCVSRRSLLRGALLGGAAVVASAGAGADASLAGDRLRAAPLPRSASRTLTLVTNRAPSDLDPHSAYDAGSGVLLQGPFEGLIRARANTTDEFVPVLAESWEASADESVWTFRLRDGVTFQDGTPLDAHAARASFERLLTLGLAPSTVLGRFLTDPAQVTASDRRTLVFDLGRPQPLFETALASAYGTAIVNTPHDQRLPLVDGTAEALGIPSRSVLLTGRYAIRSGQHPVIFTGIEGERCHLGVVFDPELDEGRCPQGHPWHHYAVNRTARGAAERGEPAVLMLARSRPSAPPTFMSVHEYGGRRFPLTGRETPSAWTISSFTVAVIAAVVLLVFLHLVADSGSVVSLRARAR